MNLQSGTSSGHEGNVKKPLVLAVDDNEDNLNLLTQLLEIIECSYITATDGHTTLAMAQNYQPDLILLDIMLPDLSGIDIAHSLKQDPQTTAIPIIAVTAMARTEDLERMLSAGCTDCVTKPYTIEHLTTTISRYVCCTNSL